MRELMNLMQLCRLCLTEVQVNISIFGEHNSEEMCSKIENCLPVKISKEDNLPKHICDKCLYKLETFHNFRSTAVSSEAKLLQWLDEIDRDTQIISSTNDNGILSENLTDDYDMDKSKFDSFLTEEDVIKTSELEDDTTIEIVMESERDVITPKRKAAKRRIPSSSDEDDILQASKVLKVDSDVVSEVLHSVKSEQDFIDDLCLRYKRSNLRRCNTPRLPVNSVPEKLYNPLYHKYKHKYELKYSVVVLGRLEKLDTKLIIPSKKMRLLLESSKVSRKKTSLEKAIEIADLDSDEDNFPVKFRRRPKRFCLFDSDDENETGSVDLEKNTSELQVAVNSETNTQESRNLAINNSCINILSDIRLCNNKGLSIFDSMSLVDISTYADEVIQNKISKIMKEKGQIAINKSKQIERESNYHQKKRKTTAGDTTKNNMYAIEEKHTKNSDQQKVKNTIEMRGIQYINNNIIKNGKKHKVKTRVTETEPNLNSVSVAEELENIAKLVEIAELSSSYSSEMQQKDADNNVEAKSKNTTALSNAVEKAKDNTNGILQKNMREKVNIQADEIKQNLTNINVQKKSKNIDGSAQEKFLSITEIREVGENLKNNFNETQLKDTFGNIQETSRIHTKEIKQKEVDYKVQEKPKHAIEIREEKSRNINGTQRKDSYSGIREKSTKYVNETKQKATNNDVCEKSKNNNKIKHKAGNGDIQRKYKSKSYSGIQDKSKSNSNESKRKDTVNRNVQEKSKPDTNETNQRDVETTVQENSKTLNDKLIHIFGERFLHQYKCDKCSEVFDDCFRLKRHTIAVHKKKLNYPSLTSKYTCFICYKKCKDQATLRTHMRVHSLKDKYNCKFCKFSATSTSDLIDHISICKGKKKSENVNDGNKHSKSVAGIEKNLGNIQNSNKKNELQNKQIFNNEETINNINCAKARNDSILKYRCSICKKKFSDIHEMRTHKKTHSTEVSSPENRVESFRSTVLLDPPAANHIPNSPSMPILDNSASSQNQITNQIVNDPPRTKPKYKCCEQIFLEKTDLFMHMKENSMNQMCNPVYACNVCLSTFKKSVGWLFHIMVAHKDFFLQESNAEYTCKICKTKFSSFDKFDKHTGTCNGPKLKRPKQATSVSDLQTKFMNFVQTAEIDNNDSFIVIDPDSDIEIDKATRTDCNAVHNEIEVTTTVFCEPEVSACKPHNEIESATISTTCELSQEILPTSTTGISEFNHEVKVASDIYEENDQIITECELKDFDISNEPDREITKDVYEEDRQITIVNELNKEFEPTLTTNITNEPDREITSDVYEEGRQITIVSELNKEFEPTFTTNITNEPDREITSDVYEEDRKITIVSELNKEFEPTFTTNITNEPDREITSDVYEEDRQITIVSELNKEFEPTFTTNITNEPDREITSDVYEEDRQITIVSELNKEFEPTNITNESDREMEPVSSVCEFDETTEELLIESKATLNLDSEINIKIEKEEIEEIIYRCDICYDEFIHQKKLLEHEAFHRELAKSATLRMSDVLHPNITDETSRATLFTSVDTVMHTPNINNISETSTIASSTTTDTSIQLPNISGTSTSPAVTNITTCEVAASKSQESVPTNITSNETTSVLLSYLQNPSEQGRRESFNESIPSKPRIFLKKIEDLMSPAFIKEKRKRLQKEAKEKTLRCEECNKIFGRLRGFNKHKKYASYKFLCTICSFSSCSNRKLKEHYYEKHSDASLYDCCGKRFFSVVDMNRHKERHICKHCNIHYPDIRAHNRVCCSPNKKNRNGPGFASPPVEAPILTHL